MRFASAQVFSLLTAWSLAAAVYGVGPAAVKPELLVRDRGDGVERIPLLPPSPDNPRNSEGSFVMLRDGRLMLVYSHFTGGGGDHSTAHLAARFSADGGHTWTGKDAMVLANEGGMNVMSASLLRLADGRIGLFYLRKNSEADCRPCLRISADEARSWGPAAECITDRVGYYVLNNDRAVQLKSGRLVLPVALHNLPSYAKPDWAGIVMCYLSDDCGHSWRRSKDQLTATTAKGKRVTTQEPGVVELRDGRLMLFARTSSGSQYVSFSRDGGDTWSPLGPSNLASPCSPAQIKRIPKTGDLLLVWNNHANVDAQHKGKRTPLSAAVSRDEGRTWEKIKTLEDDPNGWYCYPAVTMAGDHVIVAHCSGSTKIVPHLSFTQITRFSLEWLYK
jgi:sialidase-1